MTLLRILALAGLILALGACATTKQARNVETSGFLADYSKLREGEGGEALLVYISPDFDASQYDKVILEPVTLWSVGTQLKKVPYEDQQRLGTNLYEALKTEISKTHEIVQEPGPGTLRIRLALTEAGKSRAALNLITTVMPYSLALSQVKKLVTGTHSFAGSASGEVEVLDTQSGQVLMAGVDRRVGGKTLRGAASTWDDVQRSFDEWAKKIGARLRGE